MLINECIAIMIIIMFSLRTLILISGIYVSIVANKLLNFVEWFSRGKRFALIKMKCSLKNKTAPY